LNILILIKLLEEMEMTECYFNCKFHTYIIQILHNSFTIL